jgi:hypothetical protein
MNELLVMYSLNDTVKVVVGGSYLHIKRENLDEPAVVEVCPRHRPSPLRDTMHCVLVQTVTASMITNSPLVVRHSSMRFRCCPFALAWRACRRRGSKFQTRVLSTKVTAASAVDHDVIFFFDNGRFYYSDKQYTRPLHNHDAHSHPVHKSKERENRQNTYR